MTMININGITMEGSVMTRIADSAWGGRESKAVTVQLTYEEAVRLFVDDAPWSVSVDTIDEDGNERTITTDMSDYAISGPITDNRDGTVTVRMGKYRETELMQETLAAVPDNHAEALAWRGIIEEAVQSIPDDHEALIVSSLYPAWGSLLTGTEVKAGMRIRHDGKLYRVVTTHNVSADWEPGNGTEAIYTRIDEAHAGTVNDPIPYEGNMALTSGLYYSQAGATYLCTRDTGNPVHNALAALVGLYVEVVA